MHGRRVAALFVAVAMLLTACSDRSRPRSAASTPSGASSTITPPRREGSSAATTGFVPEPIAFHDCGRNLRCATVKVPLDYGDPGGPTIDIAVNEAPARDPAHRIGALLFNPGGPGGSGLSFIADGLEVPAAISNQFDLVGFDPRGVGESTKLPCGDATVPAFLHLDSSPDTPDEQAALDAGAKAVADDCGQHAGDLLPFMGTDNVVRDIDTIRQALGEPQLNYLGVSYGTELGLRYAQLFPHNVRAIVIDGVVDPTQDLRTFLRQQTIAFERQIGGIFDECPDGDPGCPDGGMRAAYDRLAAEVDAQPLAASDGSELGPSELADAAIITTYAESLVSQFYDGVTRASKGDPRELLQLAQDYRTSVEYPDYAAVECTDSPHPNGRDEFLAFAEELKSLSSRFGAAVANEMLPCAYWPAPVKSVIGPVTAPEAPPILVIGTTGDAATPYEQAVTIAKTLAHGRLLTYTGTRHAAFGVSRCAGDAEAAYFVDLQLPPDGTTCNN